MYLVILLEHPKLDGEVKVSPNSQEEADEGMEWWQDQVNEKVGKSVPKAFLGPVSFHTSIPFSSKDLLTVAVGHKPFVIVLKGYLQSWKFLIILDKNVFKTSSPLVQEELHLSQVFTEA